MNDFCSIIILLYGKIENYALECVRGIFQFSDYPFELYLIDNGVQDDIIDIIKSKISQKVFMNKFCQDVIFIDNKQNLGWAGGNNVGIRKSKGYYICLLNADTRVEENWLSKLLLPFKDSKIGGVNPYSNNTGCKEARCKERPGKMKTILAKNIFGSCMVITRDVVNKVGFFDEQFNKAHGEDDRDYSFRMAKAGFKFVVAPTFVYHHGKGSFNQLPAEEKRKRVSKGREIFIKKWGSL